LIESFDAQCQATPNAIAIDDGVDTLIYQQVFDNSLTLANTLQSKGLRAGDKVGLCFSPNQYAVTSLFACLRLSLCYVPMDVNHPVERLRFIAEDANLSLLLTQKTIAEHIALQDIQSCLFVDSLGALDREFVPNTITSEQENTLPLYVIYTSGSTGSPKGAMVSYANEKHLLDWYISEYEIDASSKTLIISSLGFDLTQKNLFAPLLTGGAVYFTASDVYDPIDILACIERQQINRINCAPSAFYPIVAAAQRTHHLDYLSHLSYVLLGGEPIVMAHLSHWLSNSGKQVQLVNMYGPTECTDISCAYTVEDLDVHSIPIGYAIPGIECLVLDEHLNVLPVGMSGELYIGGESLGLGYLNNESLNDEAFITHPLDKNKNIYRSRDIVRYVRSSKGLLLEFIARADDQVKIRGFRIELGEITNQLLAQDGIKEAAVVVSPVDGQDKLVAYLALDSADTLLNLHDLRQSLKQYLPDYMLPNAFVELEALPISANGKIDKKQLPAVTEHDFLKREYVSARNLIEAQLVDIWQDILQIENLSVYDNFFEIGGHSLLATQMIAAVADEFAIEIPLKVFFDQPTIAQCAEAINSGELVEVFSQQHPIVVVDRNRELPLSFSQERLWVIEQINPNNSAYNIPAALSLEGKLDVDAIEKTLCAIVNRHESLRTYFGLGKDGSPIQIIANKDKFTLTKIDISSELQPMQVAQKLFDDDAATPFDISSDTLFRAMLLKLSNNKYVLVATMHHIISDGWSINVLQKELVTHYAAFRLKEAVDIEALPFQYADFSVWQREQLSDDHIQSHLNFWRQELKGSPAHITLPNDKPRPSQQTFNGAVHKLTFNTSAVNKLKAFSQLHGITPFTTLLTSYALMLSKYAKQDDICIGTPVAGREQKSLESLIGYFVNAVVLRCQLDGNPSFSQLLSRLQDTSLMAFANQSVPLEKVLEVVEVERNPAYSPVSQVGFSYIGQEFTVKAKLPDLEVNYLDFNRVVAKYDLTLIVIDDGESISCEFEYNSDLFLASTIQVYAKAFEAIFTQAIDSPQLSVKQLLQLNFQQRCAAIEVNEELVERVLPLTSMQQDMVFSQLISPASLANTLGYRAEVEVDINPELWQKAFQLVTNNQSICRTVFKANKTLVGDDYYQCVLKQKGVDVELIDLRNQQLSESDVDRSVNEFIYQPLAYQQERFMRIGVLKYDGRDILLLSSHHALLDGVSIVLIAQATAAYYEQLINGGDVSQVPSLPETFDAYIEKDLSLTDTRTVKDFWENTLLPCEPLNYTLMNKSRATKTDSSVLESFPHQSKTVSKGLQLEPYHSQKIQALAFSVQHWQSIKTYCRSNKITPPQYFKLLYSLLISQYCCANHTFSMTEFSAGRDRSNALSLGCFFKQAPFVFEAGELSKDTSLNELFKTQRAFRKLIKGRSDISASLSSALQQPSTLQFMFNYYHFFPAGQTLQGKPILCIEMPPFIENTVQFIVKEQSDSVSLDLYFQDTVFDDIDFLQRLEMLSAQLVQHAEQLKQLSYLLPIEFIQQVYQWNKVEPSKALVPLAKQFEQQVSKHPEKVALDDGFETLTYAALNQRANVLAHQLQALGVGANVRVAFCLPRNTDAISIILAVIKLGACYVPIDANYPSERIALIIEASKAKFLFVARGSTLVGQHFESQTFEIFQGDIDGLTANHSSDNLSIEAHVDDSLYIIFTSGSTGTPKGAAISYANEINLMLWYTSFDFEESTACVFSPLGFDLTQKNLLAPLLSGGKLVLIGGDYDSEKILNTIETHHVTHINCAPSLFYPLVEDYDALRSNSALSHLICVSFGGEPIQINRLQPWLQSDSFDCQLYNHYGPTECTDIALFHAIDAEAALRSNYIPLGKPNVGVQTYIMNERLQLLPAGVTGEICIAGRGVGLTYINDELLNLDKFVANPLGAGKLYRTGDLGRYDSQFDIEFIGRKDHQLKLNGLRIEPGEIEFQLEALEQIQGAIVQVADEQLVAYILTETVLELADIQLSLSEYLPSYMLPKHVVCLGQWPLTANGKIDRAKLPIPSEKSSVEYTAPATEIEKDLCQILEHILQVQRVGIHDNFFDLGGHSLAASRAIVQVRQKYEIDIPLNVLFELSTVEKLAAWISASQWAMQSAQMQDDENEEDSGRDSGFI
ncbi:MAG: amino acid adenylation domain-containing protein, partial [Sinobacterium sp.]|nr:amino acid adenylation domain-containing protein [Sinobacterium sp.]